MLIFLKLKEMNVSTGKTFIKRKKFADIKPLLPYVSAKSFGIAKNRRNGPQKKY